MISVDGSHGEGGGQILRTALGLSLATGKPFRIERIRARREKPGLQNQHLACVKAAQQVGCADVEGASLGSETLSFVPQGVFPGNYRFSVGTAGSTTLVLQTVLPALILTNGASRLDIEGGTHNPWAPPFDFLQKAFLPIVNRMGPTVTVSMERAGFYPAGGGRLVVEIAPVPVLRRIAVPARGRIREKRGRVLLSNLPAHIAERELEVLRKKLQIDRASLEVESPESVGPGNAVVVEIVAEHVTEVFTAFGRVRVPAENVAGEVVREVRHYLDGEAPVGLHLADQLLVPMALAGGGNFVTGPLADHARTNIEVVKRFLDVEISVAEVTGSTVNVSISNRR